MRHSFLTRIKWNPRFGGEKQADGTCRILVSNGKLIPTAPKGIIKQQLAHAPKEWSWARRQVEKHLKQYETNFISWKGTR